MWSESSSVSAAKLVKKIGSNSRDTDFFSLGELLFLARPVYKIGLVYNYIMCYFCLLQYEILSSVLKTSFA